MDIIELAEQNQQNAWKLLDETGIIPAWERIGATVHLVGSLKSGLLMKSRDIDLHIYTGKLDITESFSVMQELAERLKLKEIQYKNLVHTEEECIEWHVLYEDQELHTWKFDLIHIRKGSKYDGTLNIDDPNGNLQMNGTIDLLDTAHTRASGNDTSDQV